MTDTKRAPRTKKPTVDQLVETAIQLVPFGALHRAPENVRHTAMDEATAELADDIQAHGLLQSLIGYGGDTAIDAGAVYIVGGGRRLAALRLLRDRKAISDKYLVPVLIRDQAEAVELSLAENLARRDMNPADEFVAFRALLAPGNVSPADLAKRFGFTEQYVKQRLRLAGLADPILDAIRQNIISLTSAYAYAATADTALQLRVFETQSKSDWQPHAEHSIRQAYLNLQATTSNRLFKSVGAEAYEAAGGGYDDDLFTATEDDGERRLDRGDLLLDLATAKVEDGPYQAAIDAAKVAYPTLGTVILCPGLIGPDAYGGKMPKAATGMSPIPPSYHSLRTTADALTFATENRIQVDVAAGLNAAGELVIVPHRFFVPSDRQREVAPEHVYEDYNSPEREAARAAEQLEASIMGHAVRLAAKANKEAGVEARVYWKNGAYAWKPVEGPDDLGPCYTVQQEVYVTVAEAEAFREQGKALHEAEAARIAEHRAAVEREKEEAAAARQQAIADLVDQQPAVVAIFRGEGEDAEAIDIIARIEDGSYVSLETGDGTIRTDLTTDVEDATPLADHLNNYGSAFRFTPLASIDEAKIACAAWFEVEQYDEDLED